MQIFEFKMVVLMPPLKPNASISGQFCDIRLKKMLS